MKDGPYVREEMLAALAETLSVVRRLRAPGGCPWDREQTHESLKPFIVEETYEVLEAIDAANPGALCEELGDLLLQILLQAEIATEEGRFTMTDVARGLTRKLMERHPHVFGRQSVDGTKQVLSNWERIKKAEKGGKRLFDGLPASLPALLMAARMGEKAGRVGFDWPGVESVRAKVVEELNETDRAVASGDRAEIEHELGDLLFAVAQWARHLGCQPEETLRDCCRRFARRFYAMERIVSDRGGILAECTIEQLEAAWQDAKKE